MVAILTMKISRKTGRQSVYFEPAGKRIFFDNESSVLDLALRNKIDLDHSCGGSGSCGTCRVRIVEGLDKLEPRNEIEDAMAKDRGFQDDERLACQIEPKDGLRIKIPE